ncbi:hypothetical protein CIL03_00885 [Virgibacillus indicus]|uniref:Fimbrial protein n=1 Tax=Virgibacillus indicus TaxID=2024554 RepID=A0A265NCH4_9BACI|nr:hypothetical protein [Virgibacillus indicus]OZU89728.1 hypothetical protein CIL03_00885 [Virgibacillus indicus]
MNTEINFLEKKPKKYAAPIFLGIVFIILLGTVAGVLVAQKNSIQSSIESEKSKIEQIEKSLMEFQKENASVQQLQQLQKDITKIKAETTPAVALYEEILGLLSTPAQLTGFTFEGEDQFIVDAEFSIIEDVSNYVASLLEQNYITDAQLTSVSLVESSYQATLTIDLNVDALVEELGENETME